MVQEKYKNLVEPIRWHLNSSCFRKVAKREQELYQPSILLPSNNQTHTRVHAQVDRESVCMKEREGSWWEKTWAMTGVWEREAEKVTYIAFVCNSLCSSSRVGVEPWRPVTCPAMPDRKWIHSPSRFSLLLRDTSFVVEDFKIFTPNRFQYQ